MSISEGKTSISISEKKMDSPNNSEQAKQKSLKTETPETRKSLKESFSIPKLDNVLNDSYENIVGKSGMFHEAAEHGNLALVSRYVRNPSTNKLKEIMLSSDFENRNALHKSCINGHLDIVKELLLHSSILRKNVDQRDLFGCTALYLACVKNKILLDNGRYATHQEVADTKLKIVQALLAPGTGAKPEHAWLRGRGTALHWCALHGFDTVVIELLKHGGDVLLYRLDYASNLPVDVAGNEVLKRRQKYEEHVRSKQGSTSDVQSDIKSLPKRELAPSDNTRIDYATVKKRKQTSALDGILQTHEACAVALITAVTLREDGTYSLRWLQSMLLWCSYFGLAPEVNDILTIGKRKDVNLSLTWGGVSTQSGRTALHLAALMGEDDIIKLLYDFYNDISQTDKFVSKEDMQKVGCCGRKKSAKQMGFINYPDHFDNTPLHLCVQLVHYPNNYGASEATATLLLEMGADASLLNAESRTPASYARGTKLRSVFETITRKQKGFEGTCFDSPHVKDENILSFDWIIRFQNYKTPDGKPTVRSEDSNSHLQEMKEYLESKRCLVRVMDDPKGEFILLMFTATEAVCRLHAGEMKIELPVINQRSDRAYDPLLAYIFEPLKSRDRIHILKAVLDMEYEIDVFVYSGIIRDYFPVHENTELESVKSRWTRGCCPEPFRTTDDLINENQSSVLTGLTTLAEYFGKSQYI
jgi:ankyrin repeat protein